ncbi:hypothetical protein ABMX62_20415 [Vibrio vulnificus]|uniref:hypothetical protein n=1 Tax=Vibrio vulnificus TaxID=672 RepID=UPI00405A350E
MKLIDRLQKALHGEVVVENSSGRNTSNQTYRVLTNYSNSSYFASLSISDHINSKVAHGEKASRQYAEASWAWSLAESINLIAGHEVYSKDAITNYRNSLKQFFSAVRKAKESIGNPYKNPEVISKKNLALASWVDRFNKDKFKDTKIEEVRKLEHSYLDEFVKEVVLVGDIDISTIKRLTPFILKNMDRIKNGENRFDCIINDAKEINELLYDECLRDLYSADRNNLNVLGKRMFEVHSPEINAFLKTLKYQPKGKKSKLITPDFDFSNAISNAHINTNNEGIPAHSELFNVAGKKSKWGLLLGISLTEESAVIASAHFSLVGRLSDTMHIGVQFNQWKDSLPYCTNEQYKSIGAAEMAYATQRAALEERIARAEKENAALLEENRRKHTEMLEKRQAEVASKISEVKKHSLVSIDTISGTYIEKKRVEKLLDYPETKSILRHSSLYGIPAVSIFMGKEHGSPRGIQYLANDGFHWKSEEGDATLNKMFEVVPYDMENCFVELGFVDENTTIIISEGFATGASIYISSKERNINCLVVCAMFADNLKNAIEHYSTKYPHNDMLLAADNDCWMNDKYGSRDLDTRQLDDNTGIRKAWELHDKYGINLFSPNWENRSIQDRAYEISATDWNDLSSLMSDEEAYDEIAMSIRNALEVYKCNKPSLWVPKNLKTSSKQSIFQLYGYDGSVTAINAVSYIDQENQTEKNDNKRYQLQRFVKGEWRVEAYNSNASSALISLAIAREEITQLYYSHLVNVLGHQEITAQQIATSYAHDSLRCFDIKNNTTINQNLRASLINASTRLLDCPVSLFVAVHSDKFTTPVRCDNEGNYIVGGSRDLQVATFTTREEVALAIFDLTDTSVLYDLDLNESNIGIADIGTNGRADRSTLTLYSERFGESANETILKLEQSIPKPNLMCFDDFNEAEIVELMVYDNEDIGRDPLRESVLRNELNFAIEDFENENLTVNIAHPGSIELHRDQFESALTQGHYQVVTYAPNGLANSAIEFGSIDLAQKHVDNFNMKYSMLTIKEFGQGDYFPVSILCDLDPLEINIKHQIKEDCVFEEGNLHQMIESLSDGFEYESIIPFSSKDVITKTDEHWYYWKNSTNVVSELTLLSSISNDQNNDVLKEIPNDSEIEFGTSDARFDQQYSSVEYEHQMDQDSTDTWYEPYLISGTAQAGSMPFGVDFNNPLDDEDIDHDVSFDDEDIDHDIPFDNEDIDHDISFDDEDIDHDIPFDDEDIDHDISFDDEDIDHDIPFDDEDIDHDIPFDDEDIDHDIPFDGEDIDHNIPFGDDTIIETENKILFRIGTPSHDVTTIPVDEPSTIDQMMSTDSLSTSVAEANDLFPHGVAKALADSDEWSVANTRLNTAGWSEVNVTSFIVKGVPANIVTPQKIKLMEPDPISKHDLARIMFNSKQRAIEKLVAEAEPQNRTAELLQEKRNQLALSVEQSLIAQPIYADNEASQIAQRSAIENAETVESLPSIEQTHRRQYSEQPSNSDSMSEGLSKIADLLKVIESNPRAVAAIEQALTFGVSTESDRQKTAIIGENDEHQIDEIHSLEPEQDALAIVDRLQDGTSDQADVVMKATFELLVSRKDDSDEGIQRAANDVYIALSHENTLTQIDRAMLATIVQNTSNRISTHLKSTIDIYANKSYQSMGQPAFSKLSEAAKTFVYEAIDLPINNTNRVYKCNEIKDWSAIKDALEVKWLPEELVKQAIITKWNTYGGQNPTQKINRLAKDPIDEAIKTFIKRAESSDLLESNPSDPKIVSYIENGTHMDLSIQELRYKTAQWIATYDLEVAKSASVAELIGGKRNIDIIVAQAFESLTQIQVPDDVVNLSNKKPYEFHEVVNENRGVSR